MTTSDLLPLRNQPPDFLKPPALLGVTISGRGRSAPSGGWPWAGWVRWGKLPSWPNPAIPRKGEAAGWRTRASRGVSRGPVEAEGGRVRV
jgi:hypothetical protein